MDQENDSGHFELTQFSTGGGFTDLAATAHMGAFRPDKFEDEEGLDDEFGRWLEVQSLRFRGKQLAD